jgi:dTDP-4-amino-4,6-dideoxygalactose transaminase
VKFIGGFFELAVPGAAKGGLADFWQMPSNPDFTYGNARSALAALLRSVQPEKLWLPAYICCSVTQAAAAAAVPVGYFPLSEDLQPDVNFLDAQVQTGEMVLAVDYFGAPPGREFLSFVETRNDLLFIEDAAQAFDTGMKAWGRWRLYSPRKLVGVTDGGFIVPSDQIAPSYAANADSDPEIQHAARLRFNDKEGRCNPEWHAANQKREGAETVMACRISVESQRTLEALSVESIATKRQENFRTLTLQLSRLSFLKTATPEFVPMGFPIRVPAAIRTKIRKILIDNHIFPSIHWENLPSPTSFVPEHRLARELLTLPCDQRYDVHDMNRVAALVLASA